MTIQHYFRNNLEIIEATIKENSFRFSPFGGQLIGWEKGGIPIIFENRESAITDGTTAYRGGAPIIFPYFGKGLLMPKGVALDPQHGAARKTVWNKKEISEEKLFFSSEFLSPPPYPSTTFLLEVGYIFSSGRIPTALTTEENLSWDIAIEAKITNIGNVACPYQFAIHSYWQTEDLSLTTVSGLGDEYRDNLNNLVLTKDTPASNKIFKAPIDRIYSLSNDVPQSASFDAMVLVTAPRYTLTIEAVGEMNSTVVWNPGANHGFKDLHSPNFLCVESAIIDPPGEIHPRQSQNHQIRYRAEI